MEAIKGEVHITSKDRRRADVPAAATSSKKTHYSQNKQATKKKKKTLQQKKRERYSHSSEVYVLPFLSSSFNQLLAC